MSSTSFRPPQALTTSDAGRCVGEPSAYVIEINRIFATFFSYCVKLTRVFRIT
jgi:hypothetical protein